MKYSRSIIYKRQIMRRWGKNPFLKIKRTVANIRRISLKTLYFLRCIKKLYK